MTASWWFLVVSALGALFTLNAYRPFRFSLGLVTAFFASWLTIELAGHHLVWQAVATVVFARLGAFDHWPGWLGLAVTLVSWAGLAGLVRSARRVETEVETALAEALGDDYRDALHPELFTGHDLRLPRSRLALAFYFRRGDVHRAKNIAYGPHGRRNLLDVWHHREGAERAPVLLWVHGGAWIVGHKAQQALPMLNHMAARGWVCVSINYRLSPRAKFPDHVVDVKRAIAWIREHIHAYGGDPDFVLLTGGSAGGHLAAMAALSANDPEYQPGFEAPDTTVQACAPFYGVYDLTNRLGSRRRLDAWGFLNMLERRMMHARLRDDPDAFRRASPIDRVHEDAPPFLVIHGTHDVFAPVADAREFVRRLRQVSGEPVAYAELHRTQHAFDVFHSIRTVHVVRGVERFGAWAHSRHLAREDAARRVG